MINNNAHYISLSVFMLKCPSTSCGMHIFEHHVLGHCNLRRSRFFHIFTQTHILHIFTGNGNKRQHAIIPFVWYRGECDVNLLD